MNIVKAHFLITILFALVVIAIACSQPEATKTPMPAEIREPKLAFVSNMDCQPWFDVYTINADGENLRRLTTLGEFGEPAPPSAFPFDGPYWSPDTSITYILA